MSTRRSLFAPGVLLAAVALLAPPPTAAQEITLVSATATADHTKLTVTWTYTGTGDEASISTREGLGFNVYYVKGTDTNALNSATKIGNAMDVDAGLPSGKNRGETSAADATILTYELKGLTGDTDYVVTVIDYDTEGTDLSSPPTAGMAKTAKAPPPADVRNVKVTPGDEMLTVSWDRPPHTGAADLTIAEYKVQYRTARTLAEDVGPWIAYPAATATTKLTATKAEIKNLLNDVEYEVQVQAKNSGGASSSWAPEVPVKGMPDADGMPDAEDEEEEEEGTPTTTPTTDDEEVRAGEPAKVMLTKNTATAGDKSLTVAWIEPGSGGSPLLGFQVKAMMSDGTGTPTVMELAATARTATVTGLTNAKMYMVMVRARNSVDYGPWSDAAEGTPKAAAAKAGPAKMMPPMVEAGDKMLMVSWKEPASDRSISHYQLDYKTASAAKWLEKKMDVTAMDYTIDGLINDTAYLVRVRAVDGGGGMGVWSDHASGTPMAEAMPTPALPVFGAFALGASLLVAGRARMRRRAELRGRAQRQLTR